MGWTAQVTTRDQHGLADSSICLTARWWADGFVHCSLFIHCVNMAYLPKAVFNLVSLVSGETVLVPLVEGEGQGVWRMESPSGVRGRAPVGGLEDEVPQKLKAFVKLCMQICTLRHTCRCRICDKGYAYFTENWIWQTSAQIDIICGHDHDCMSHST